MRAATVLPLKPEPVVAGSKDSNIEGIDERLDMVAEEPNSNGRVLLNSFVASCVLQLCPSLCYQPT